MRIFLLLSKPTWTSRTFVYFGLIILSQSLFFYNLFLLLLQSHLSTNRENVEESLPSLHAVAVSQRIDFVINWNRFPMLHPNERYILNNAIASTFNSVQISRLIAFFVFSAEVSIYQIVVFHRFRCALKITKKKQN